MPEMFTASMPDTERSLRSHGTGMIKRHIRLAQFLILLFCAVSLSAQSVEQVRNDAYHYELRTVDGVQVFVIREVNPVQPGELRVPRRVLRIPLNGAAPFDVVVQTARMSPPVDAIPFYLVNMIMGADSAMTSRIVPYTGAINDPAIGKGVEVLARRIVYEARQPVLEVELPLLIWDVKTQQTQWVEEYTLVRVPSDGFARTLAAETKPPYMSMPFTTRSRNVDTSQAWIDFTAPMIKFFVRQDGLFKITADWLREAGKDPSQVDPARVQLYRKGVAIPMYASGMGDGRFDDGDYFVFNGTRNYDEGGYRHLVAAINDPYPQYLSIYTDSTAYWLNFNLDGAARAEVRPPVTPLPADTIDWTYETMHIESDPSGFLLPHTTDLVRGQMSDWTSEDTWCMGIMTLEPGKGDFITYNPKFQVSDVYTGADARFWYKLVSWYGDRQALPNHSVSMRLNGGSTMDSVIFNHDEQVLLYGTESASALLVGTDNIFGLTSWNISTSSSSLRVDWLDVEYPRYLTMGGASRIFRIDSVFPAGLKSVKLQGVQTPDPFVLRVRDGSSALIEVAAFSGSGPYTVYLADSFLPGDLLYVWNANDIPVAVKGEARTLARLDQEEAEDLIVTARAFHTASTEYASFITGSYGVSTRVVDVEDIYDIYSYGMFQPEAIKLLVFDGYYGWNTDSLKYLFLVGDANYNYKASYTPNIVPSYGNPVSDTWFVAFDDFSSVPQLQVGRLPAREEIWVRQYLDRHRDYRQQLPTLWNKSTIHFSGGNLSGGEAELQRYKSVNDDLIANVDLQPEFSARVAHFYKTLEPQSDFGPLSLPEVRSRIAEGGVFICYVGHSGTQTWDNSISRADQLANSEGRASLVTDFGCSTGRYAEPDYSSFSEIFVTGDQSHAIAYIGNSAAGFDFTATVLPGYFYEALITDHARSLGEAHMTTRLRLGTWNAVNRVSIQTNLLIGDPIVALDLPEQPNPIVKDSWLRAETEIITDVMDSVSFTIVVGNYGLQTPDSLDILVENLQDGILTATYRLTHILPALYDTLKYRFGLTGAAGSGLLRVTLDPDGKLAEIFENDNIATLDYKIFSTFLKVANDRLGTVSSRGSDVTILNPAFDPGSVSTLTVESDRAANFTSPTRATLPYMKTISPGDVPALFPVGEKRYWRVKLDAAGQDFVGPYARRNTAVPSDFVQADSLEFLAAPMDFVRWDDSAIGFPPGRRVELLSSNYTLGSAVHINIDGVNVLPSSIAWAYCIAVVDSASLLVKRIGIFNNYSVPEHRDSIRRWAEEVTFGEYFMVTTGNEPRAGSDVFSEQIKALGSKYIDSVRTKAWRPSWAFIGRRGAPIGTMPEVYFSEASRTPGVIDTTFYIAPDTGKVISPLIGPAVHWNSAHLERSDPGISDIRLSIYGIRRNLQEELVLEAGNVAQADLSSIDAAAYPYIRMQAEFYPQGGDPRLAKLHAWSASCTQVPELALNYQSVAILQDSVQQGAPAEIGIGIINAGEGDAAAFPVQLEVVGADNIPRPAGQFTVAGLRSGAWFDTTAAINTDFLSGPYQVFVRVDRDDAILEQYEDNNAFVSAVYVKPDTSRPQLEVTFDSYAPIDDDYIRYNPEIVLTLRSNNPVPVTSKDNFTITLDGEEMDLDSIGFTMTPATNNQPATLRFQPTLKDGIYYFGFNAEDAKKTKVYDEVKEVRLRVSTQSRIAELYNYPNPFQGETSFTFLLTGMEPPKEVEVKIYTVAGRLIRKISYPASSMRVGYNALKWDGRDEDGDELANGVYFYKIIAKFTDETFENIGRMAVMR
ncbi:MAG: C25 family cysteine peptidase [Bacteroidota bacterium]